MGCSSITHTTEDNLHFLARTMDFSMDPGSGLLILPRGQEVTLSKAGNRIKLQYAILGMGAKDIRQLTLYDGLNENHVMGAVLYYPGAVYAESAGAAQNPVNPVCALLYLLGGSKTLGDIKKLAGAMTLVDEANPILGHAPPLHFIFSDASGKTLILEPDRDGMSYYEDNVGVMTNAPAYPWHETNLRNYIGLNPRPASPLRMEGTEFAPFGQGSGTYGLPGDFTGPSRFVRAAYMKHNARRGKNEIDGMNQCMHILSSVNIPDGAVITPDGATDFTRYTCAMCAQSRTYYFHTYGCRRIHAASLTEADCSLTAPVCHDWPDAADIRYLK